MPGIVAQPARDVKPLSLSPQRQRGTEKNSSRKQENTKINRYPTVGDGFEILRGICDSAIEKADALAQGEVFVPLSR